MTMPVPLWKKVELSPALQLLISRVLRVAAHGHGELKINIRPASSNDLVSLHIIGGEGDIATMPRGA